MDYVFHLAELPSGSSTLNTCEFDGQTYAALSAHDLARILVRAGAPDGGVVAVRGEMRCWTSRWHALAARTLSEGDSGFRTGWWKRYLKSPADPLVEAVVIQERVRAGARAAARTASGGNLVSDAGRGGKAAGEAMAVPA